MLVLPFISIWLIAFVFSIIITFFFLVLILDLTCMTDTTFAVEEGRKFVEASKNGNLIPLCQSIFADQLTPVLAYRILVKEDDRESPSFLFESAEPSYHASSVVSVLLVVL